MTPSYQQVNLDYSRLGTGTEIFVQTLGTFTAADVAKNSKADGSDRQLRFERLLCILSVELGTQDIAVFISWRNGRRRMDKGCIGHSIARGFLERPVDSEVGYVTHVRVRGECRND